MFNEKAKQKRFEKKGRPFSWYIWLIVGGLFLIGIAAALSR